MYYIINNRKFLNYLAKTELESFRGRFKESH